MKLLFVDGTKGFAPARLQERAAGGILSSLTILPRFLASRGHEVYVKSVFDKNETVEGVHYLSLKHELLTCDAVVFNRNVLNRGLLNQAKALGAAVVWWLHDVVDHRYLIDDAFTQVQNIVSLSAYCTRTYSAYYEIPESRFTMIPNGVDKKVFFPGHYGKRKKGLYLYASAPIKGTKPLAFTLHNLRRHDPKAELRMYASQRLHDINDDAMVKHLLNVVKEAGGTILDPVPQEELAKVMREAWALLMPNSYPEICSNLLLQARASGLPVVASSTGSIPEFLTHGVNGLLTKSHPHDLYFWWKEFADLSLDLLLKDKLHESISARAPNGLLSWTDVGMRWETYLKGLVENHGK